MINPRKVSAMSRKTLFEQNEGRTVLELKEYCEDQPIWKGLLRSALAGIVLYVIALAALVMADQNTVQHIYRRLGNLGTVLAVAGSMAAFAAIYALVSDAIFRHRFKAMRSTLSRYRSDVLRIDRLEHEQDKA